MSGEMPAACAIGFAASLTPLPAAEATLLKAEKPPPIIPPIAEVSGQSVSRVAMPRLRGHATSRRNGARCRQPRCDIATGDESNTAADNPPDTGTQPKAARRWCAACIGVNCAQPYAGAQQAEKELDGDNQDDATEDRGPRNAAVRVRPDGSDRIHRRRRRAGFVISAR